jgi:hypothetical protein
MMRPRSSALTTFVAASIGGGLFVGPAGCNSAASSRADAGAALERFDAHKSEFIARCEAFERAWPRYREALFLSVDGVERPEPMDDRRIAMRDGDDIELEYEAMDGASDADFGGTSGGAAVASPGAARSVTVEERSMLRGVDGAPARSAAEARRWVRRFVVHGVASGRDIWVHVPVRDAAGAPIAVEVNGAPLHPEAGATMVRVPLARDEATLISLPLR